MLQTNSQGPSQPFVHFSLTPLQSAGYGKLCDCSLVANIRTKVQRRLQQLLKEEELRPAGLARRMGKSRAWATQVLNGERSTKKETLEAIELEFGKPAGWFSGLSTDSNDTDQDDHTSTGKPPVKTKTGARDGSPENTARVLRQRIAELESENKHLLGSLARIADAADDFLGIVRRERRQRKA